MRKPKYGPSPDVVRVCSIAHHRNGISGEPFDVVSFMLAEDGIQRRMLAIVFPEPGHVAVIDPALAASGVVGFDENSWRGDWFEPWLREQITHHGHTTTEAS